MGVHNILNMTVSVCLVAGPSLHFPHFDMFISASLRSVLKPALLVLCKKKSGPLNYICFYLGFWCAISLCRVYLVRVGR